jgi:hypothetical protein
MLLHVRYFTYLNKKNVRFEVGAAGLLEISGLQE